MSGQAERHCHRCGVSEAAAENHAERMCQDDAACYRAFLDGGEDMHVMDPQGFTRVVRIWAAQRIDFYGRYEDPKP